MGPSRNEYRVPLFFHSINPSPLMPSEFIHTPEFAAPIPRRLISIMLILSATCITLLLCVPSPSPATPGSTATAAR
jgi:hypothetical protein